MHDTGTTSRGNFTPVVAICQSSHLARKRLSYRNVNPGERILGVEGGGTKTAWALVEQDGGDFKILEQGKLPASNFRLTPSARLRAILGELPKEISRAGIFLAGCGRQDRESLSRLCAEIWPKAKIVVGSDRDSGMAAALGQGDG